MLLYKTMLRRTEGRRGKKYEYELVRLTATHFQDSGLSNYSGRKTRTTRDIMLLITIYTMPSSRSDLSTHARHVKLCQIWQRQRLLHKC
jgi:hypothetical protein